MDELQGVLRPSSHRSWTTIGGIDILTSLPACVVSGCQRAFQMGVHSVAIGSPIVPGDSGSRMVEQLRQIVEFAER